MACGVALKRSLDFDPLHNSSPSPPRKSQPTHLASKRRRFSFSQRCGAPLQKEEETSSSSIWNRYSSSDLSTKPTVTSQSPFKSASAKAAFSSEEIVKHIYQEYRRIKRRRQIQAPLSPCSSGPLSPTNGGGMHVDSFGANTDAITLDPSNSTSVVMDGRKNVDAPLLSMRQVGILCERLLKEQEERISSEYDKVLIGKLTDQYDAFVKFSHDQLRRQITNQPASYVS